MSIHVCCDAAFKIDVPSTQAFDESVGLFSVHHELYQIIGSAKADVTLVPVHHYSMLLYNGPMVDPTESKSYREFQCIVRPPQRGQFLLHIFTKDSNGSQSICQHNTKLKEDDSAIKIACVPLSKSYSAQLEVIDCYDPVKTFPPCRGTVWGRLTEQSDGSLPVSTKMSIRAMVENPQLGFVTLRWARLPVLYDLVVKRRDPSTRVKIEHIPPPADLQLVGNPRKNDDHFVLDEEENDVYLTFTLRFMTYGEHGVEVYVDSGHRREKHRLYELIGQFLFDIRPKQEPSNSTRCLDQILADAQFPMNHHPE